MKLQLKPIISAVGGAIKRNAPGILMAAGIGGFITTTVLAVRATPNAIRAIDRAESEKGETLTKLETVKAAAPYYIWPTMTGLTSTGCVIGSFCIQNGKLSAATTVLQLAEEGFANYKTVVREEVGDKKEAVIAEKAAVRRLPEGDCMPDVELKYGEYVFYDPWRGEPRGCNLDRINAAVKQVESLLRDGEDFVSLNYFWSLLGWKGTQFGNYVGFTNRDNRKEWPYITFGHSSFGQNGGSCTVMEYDVYLCETRRKLYGADHVL